MANKSTMGDPAKSVFAALYADQKGYMWKVEANGKSIPLWITLEYKR